MKTTSGKLIADAPETCPDILYAGGFNAPDEIIYFECGSRKAVIVSVLEIERARAQRRRNVEVIPREQFFKHGDRDRSTPELIKRLSAMLGVNSWNVPEDFGLAYADSLRADGLCVTPARGEFFPRRSVKTKSEITKLKYVMGVTEQAMLLARDIIAKAKIDSRGRLCSGSGVITSEGLRATLESFMKEQSCTASQTITACGVCASQPHNTGSGALMAGETIVCDIFPRDDRTGYWGDMTRTFVRGRAKPVAKRAFNAVLKASQAAEKMIKAGVIAADVHNTAAAIMEEAGFPCRMNAAGAPCGFFHGLGHGVGLDIHEYPRVSPPNRRPLAAGNVISNEPGLYDPAWGGIRLEDVLTVTKDGSVNFYTMPKDMEL